MPILSLQSLNLADKKLLWSDSFGSGLSLSVAEVTKKHTGPVLVIASSARTASKIESEIAFFLGNSSQVMQFPDWETLPYDHFSPHQDIISKRLKTLYSLPEKSSGVTVVPVMTMMHRLPPKDFVQGRSFSYKVGQKINLERLRKKLQYSGYRTTETVIERGEYSIRGSKIDIYPMGALLPFRIDLFDDEIESLRTFDPDSQLTKEKVDSISLLPAKEIPLDNDSITRFKKKWIEKFDVDNRNSTIYSSIKNGIAPQGIEYFLPLFFSECTSFFDYLPENCLIVIDDDTKTNAENFWCNIKSRFKECNIDSKNPVLPPDEVFISPYEIFVALENYPYKKIYIERNSSIKSTDSFSLNFQPMPNIPGDTDILDTLKKLEVFSGKIDNRILLCAETNGRKEALGDILQSNKIKYYEAETWDDFLKTKDNISITTYPIERGFHLTRPNILLITESELFGLKIIQNRRRARKSSRSEQAIKNLSELSIGSPVVHIEHGIGRYLGLKTINTNNWPQEFLTLEYADKAKLYVPVSSLNLINRYSGVEEIQAPLHKLGGEQWIKSKDKALKQISDTAVELLDIYSSRASKKGFACKVNPEAYQNFCNDFPYEETPDQIETIEAMKRDMVSDQPMDRLICGDVGFGKTEVAMRAAFIAVSSGKQVIILVPTTLLVHQHVENFRDRFANLPIEIGELSRFISTKDQQAIFKGASTGKIDILIGTHKLLHAKIDFRDLGLLVIDEEHRFGVKQKEAIKEFRTNIDVLTLTATPIPRTLNLSMSGIKDLSIIATAPAKRLSVKTFLREKNSDVIREAVLREILRGGQIFYVHNEVRTIEQTAAWLAELLPEARVNFAHGQMREKNLEYVMSDFYHQRFNVLVCSTIIENGIDIPTANTILISKADKFGLAQLHQLRGRVGRSHHQAYAYLLVTDIRSLTSNAFKRLEAIRDANQLGSGFTLATHDLEIRGAGELLGKGQSGHIQSIGFTLYTELLDKAVKAIRSGKSPNLSMLAINPVEIKLNIPALIPEDYLPDVHMRLILYKRIANSDSDGELRELQVEMIDRFGLIDGYLKNLFSVTSLKLYAKKLGVTKLELGDKNGRLEFASDTSIDPKNIINLVQKKPNLFRFDGPSALKFDLDILTADQRILKAKDLLDSLAPTLD